MLIKARRDLWPVHRVFVNARTDVLRLQNRAKTSKIIGVIAVSNEYRVYVQTSRSGCKYTSSFCRPTLTERLYVGNFVAMVFRDKSVSLCRRLFHYFL